MRIVAVTVDYNGHADTVRCLETLLSSSGVDLRVVVVDNGSSEPFCLPNVTGERVELLRLETNRGFAGGYNIGIRRALERGAESVFVVNNDTVVAEDAIRLLVNAVAVGAGIAAPRIFYMTDPHRIWSDGFAAGVWTLEMREGRRGQIERPGDAPAVREVDYVLGCALLVRRDVLETVGLFDERFFAYYEDLDFSLRVRQAGYRICVVPAARLWHKVAGTTGLSTPRRQYLMAYGSVRFFAKHAGRRWPFVVLARTASLLKTLAQLALHRQWRLMGAHVRGIWGGLRDSFKKQ